MVRVRRLEWRVVDVRPYDECHLVVLVGGGGTNLGVERRVLAPFDVFEPLDRPPRLRVVRGPTWRRRCRALLANHTPPGGLRAACRARIELLPHQLEPALAVVSGAGSRLLLADEVGLGKTIEAGLVLSELCARGAVERALVLTPAGLRDQWSAELAGRFDVSAPVVDAREVRRRAAELPPAVNPWSTIPVAIASVDYVKRAEVRPAVLGCRWDLLVVDEAHGVATDSDRRDAVAALAARASYVVLLTATPHSGNAETFQALCDLGARGDSLLLFRRTRADVRLAARRRVHKLWVRPSVAERLMHALVDEFSHAVLVAARRHRRDGSRANAVWLALSVLHKRALSSAWALERSVARRLAALDGARDSSARQLLLPLADAAGELDGADEPGPWPEALTLEDRGHERRMLQKLAAAARLAVAHETKIAAIGRLLARANEPAVVFTEYRDTLLHLRERLGRPAAVLHGGLMREERADAIREFVSGRCRVLLATDAAAEGLNLHDTCRIVVNLELPWNPMRLEQRIGRVDRLGQRRTVHAFHLVAAGTGETRVLERLSARVARARQDIWAADPLEDSDDAVARAAIGGELGPVSPPIDVSSTRRPVAVRLEAQAGAEAVRVAAARAHLRGGREAAPASVDAGTPWLCIVRGHRSRTALRSRVLLVWRAAAVDEAGRLCDWTLVPLAIHLRCRPLDASPRRFAGAMLDAVRHEVLAIARGGSGEWRQTVERWAQAFASTRLARERAIRSSLVEQAAPACQPGLFDRRAERAHVESNAAAAEAAGEAAQRVERWKQATRIAAWPIELVLVVAPA